MNKGETVRWYLFSVGEEIDMHAAHWLGNTLIHRNHRTDLMGTFPLTVKVHCMKLVEQHSGA